MISFPLYSDNIVTETSFRRSCVGEVDFIQFNGSLTPHSRRVRPKAAPGVSGTPGIVAVASRGDHTRPRAVFTTFC